MIALYISHTIPDSRSAPKQLLYYITPTERSSITSARLGGGLSQNADTADALEGVGAV